MSTKPCYLLTSREKFLEQLGNGYFDLDSHIPTGKPLPAILLPKKDLSLESENTNLETKSSSEQTPLSVSLSDGTYQKYKRLMNGMWEVNHFNQAGELLFSEIKETPNGTLGVIATNTSKSVPPTRENMLSWLKTLFPPTKSDK